jgi:hypothetical protein
MFDVELDNQEFNIKHQKNSIIKFVFE